MTKSRRRGAVPLPFMMAELTLASWEVIALRTAMMMQGAFPPAEYVRMHAEKIAAAQACALALASGAGAAAVLSPWHRRARANARRLRRKK